MSVLGQLLRNRIDNPQVPITSATLAEYLGGTKVLAGVRVNEQRAYGLTAYYRGVALLASTMAALPLKVYREGTKDRIVRRTVLDKPNPGQTPFEFWQAYYANAITWGTGYAQKIRDGGDIVQELWGIHPSNARMRRVKPTKAVPDGRVFEITDMEGVQRETNAFEIMAMPYLSIHGSEGLRPLQLARQVLGINVAAEETAARFYGQGTLAQAIITTEQKLDKAQRLSIKESWRDRVAGQQNAGEIAVLDAGAKFQPISIPPGDAQLLESRQFGTEEIARLLGVPPFLLMDNEKTTSWGTGIEQQMIGLVRFTLNGWYTLGEQRITNDLFPGFTEYAEYSVEGLLRGDSAARAAFYHSLRQDAVITGNEIRTFENLPPIEGGDDLFIPAGVLPAAAAEFNAKVQALYLLIRGGFEADAACKAVGLDPIAHSGLVPTTTVKFEDPNAPTP